MSFPAYESYKDSGVAWLGRVPGAWSVKRLGHYFDERRTKVSDVDYPALSVTKNGIVPQLETAAKTDDGDNRKLVLAGDFVINSRSDRKGSSGLSELDGSVSLINTVLESQPGIIGRFAHHLLRSVDFQEEYYRYGKGIVADLWSTNYSEARNIVLAVPSEAEQRAIAAFLDRETAKIDALVEAQRRLIEVLKEKRQAVISYAVTKGRDPSAPMKDSGVEWLGQVPAHWEIVPIKRVTETIEQGWSPQCENYPVQSRDEWGVLKVGCVNGGLFSPEENKTLPAELEPMPELGIRSGDLLVSRANTRELVGSAAVAEDAHPNLLLCDKLYRLRLDLERCRPALLAFFLGCREARSQIELAATGASASMLNIGQAVILELPLPLPPADEQTGILDWLESGLAKIDSLTAEAQMATAVLKERRAALISAAVTGKIDVRSLVKMVEAA